MISEFLVVTWSVAAVLSVAANSIGLLLAASACIAFHVVLLSQRWNEWLQKLKTLTQCDDSLIAGTSAPLEQLEALHYRLNALRWESARTQFKPLKVEHKHQVERGNLLQQLAAELRQRFRCRLAALALLRQERVDLIFSEPVDAATEQLLRRSLGALLQRPESACGLCRDYLKGPERDLSIYGTGIRYGLTQTVTAPNGPGFLIWLGYSENTPPYKAEADYLASCAENLGAQVALLEDLINLRERLTLAERHDQRQHDYFSQISHDVRSPLNNVRSILGLFKLEGIGADAPRLIDTALGNCELAAELLEDVLDYARYRENAIVARPLQIDPGAIVAGVFRNFSAISELRGLDYRLVLPDGTSRVLFDAKHLKRIATNLLSNAIKYTDHGGVTVELARVSEHSYALAVTDSGPGLDAAVLERLSAPLFGPGSAEVKDRSGRVELFAEGCGLGLAVSRILCAANGTQLSFMNLPGGGTRVTMELGQSDGALNRSAA